MSTANFLAGIANAAMQEQNKSHMAKSGAKNTENDDTSRTLEIENAESKVITTGPSFIESLRSPIVEVTVGAGDEKIVLTAHEALLLKSPWFATAIGALPPDARSRRIAFQDEHLDAVGSFLEFLYTGDYFPRNAGDGLESRHTSTMDDGTQLLRHARVYILADKLGIADLKSLAHSKVYHINSTVNGEIAYARFVYGNTPKDDTTLREPIAIFWGQRSHILRHDVEEEFRALCTEFPEFAFDVLSYVLDSRERKNKEKEREREHSVISRAETPKSGRKRIRHI